MEDRYTAGLTARVQRDLAPGETYRLAVPLLARAFTFNVTILAAAAAGLGSLAVARTGDVAWIGASAGAVFGTISGVLVTRFRQRSVAPAGFEGLSSMLVLVVTDRRLLLYRRSLGNQARELQAVVRRHDVTSVIVEQGTFLRPRPVTITLAGSAMLQFEGARADSIARLPAAAGDPENGHR